MASIQERATKYAANTQPNGSVPYKVAKPLSRGTAPSGTVQQMNAGILHGPTAKSR